VSAVWEPEYESLAWFWFRASFFLWGEVTNCGRLSPALIHQFSKDRERHLGREPLIDAGMKTYSLVVFLRVSCVFQANVAQIVARAMPELGEQASKASSIPCRDSFLCAGTQ